MAEFICRNSKCPMEGILAKVGNVTYKMVDMSLKADERFCPACEEEREGIKKYSGTEGFYLQESLGSINKNWTKNNGKTIY